MKNKYYVSSSVIALVGACAASGVAAQNAPPGAWATGCDVNAFTPILSDQTGEILYWNNPTCPAGSGATDATPMPIGYGA